jgi:hypothetical protein
MFVLPPGTQPSWAIEGNRNEVAKWIGSKAPQGPRSGERGVRPSCAGSSSDGMEPDFLDQGGRAERVVEHPRGTVDRVDRPFHLRLERGSAAVEFALVLPVIVMLVMVVVQVGMIVQTQLMLTNAAREGARAAAVAIESSEAVSAALAVLPERVAGGARVTVERQIQVGGRAKVTVEYPVTLFGKLGGGVPLMLRSSAEMRVER